MTENMTKDSGGVTTTVLGEKDPDVGLCSKYKLSPEQIEYVRHQKREDTRLAAPPGAGKTRCILEKMRYQVLKGIEKPRRQAFLTFSKFTRVDTVRRILEDYDDHDKWIDEKMLYTIDAFARGILVSQSNKRANNVEILSLTLRNILRKATPEQVRQMLYIKDIEVYWVDEAQDLNRVQWDIVCLLKEKTGAIIHLIGDPNQNLYGFRGSSDKYFFKFQGTPFALTQVYRSSGNISGFARCLRGYVFGNMDSFQEKNMGYMGELVEIVIKRRKALHEWLINYLRKECPELEEVTIACPTKGNGAIKDVGLSVVTNLLHFHKIPFVQHYDEAGGSSDDKTPKRPKKTKGCVNLMTYIGTKGLEGHTYIIMDFHNALYNRLPSTRAEYWDQLNLLHVICSRATHRMKICSYEDQKIHPWISKVDPKYYKVSNGADLTNLQFPFSRERAPTPVTAIATMVERLPPTTLDKIYSLLNTKVVSRRIMKDYSTVDREGDEMLLSLYIKELFTLQLRERMGKPPRAFKVIDNMLRQNYIILQDFEYGPVRDFISRNRNLTWDSFSEMKNDIDGRVRDIIVNRFDRKVEFYENVISTGEMKSIIEENRDSIKECYEKYLAAKTWDQAFPDLFYLTVIVYSLESGHYYHIHSRGASKAHIFNRFLGLFYDMDGYVQGACDKWKTSNIREQVPCGWEPLQLNGEADIMFGDTIVDIKCISELYIRHYILLLLMNFCYSVTANEATGKRVDPRYDSTSIIINPYQGLEYTVDVMVTPADMFKILNMLADDCNLKFSGLNIVYDLETTGLIKRVAGRTIVPEIVQISMKDYDTGLLLYNHHVKPKQKLSEEVKKIIGIDDSKLVNKPSIDTTRKWMGIQLRNIRDMKMYAHNGNSFDAPILEYYRIIPTSVNTSWYDTISVINMSYKEKLVSRKLGDLHQLFIGRPIKNQHTSMADVDALISIMRHLEVDL